MVITTPAVAAPTHTVPTPVPPPRALQRILIAGALALAAALLPAARAQPESRATEDASLPRPRIGLVLSGGGARGLAHVGVLKVLERERIPIDVIAGTSMGAIIGGLYASGMSAATLEREVLQIEWSDVFANRVERRSLTQRRKEEDYAVSPLTEFGIADGEVRAPVSAVSARGLELLLRRYTLPVRAVDDFARLPIPFRAVATDLETGQPVVLSSGDLALAMRSSMSVPGVFAPTEVAGRILGDGGLVNNVPIDIARAMGADIVIVVNIGTPLAARDTLGTAIGVTAQMINILTEQNVQRSLATLGPRDVLLTPRLDALGSSDFDRAGEFVERGAAGAERQLAVLQRLALEPAAYAAWQQQHRAAASPAVVLEFIAFEGSGYTNPARFQSAFESQVGQLFDRAKAERDAQRLAASGDYLRTDYRIARDGEREGLVFELDDKPWGPDFLRLGLTLGTDFRGDSTFNLALLHTRHWLDASGAEWRNVLQIGEQPLLMSDLYYPLNINLGLHDDWFVAPYLGLGRRKLVLYENRNDAGLELARFLNDTQELGLDIGRPWRNLGEFRLGLSWLRYRNVADDIGARVIEGFSGQEFIERGLRVRLGSDQLDYAYFPTAGWRVDAELAGGARSGRGENDFFRADVEATAVGTYGRHTLELFALVQATNPDGLEIVGRYALGGFQRLSGYHRNQLNGNAVALLRLGWRTPLTGEVAFARALTLGATLEAGNAWPERSAAKWSDLRTGSSLYVGSDTGIGPVYFGLTYAPRGSFGVAFYVGRP